MTGRMRTRPLGTSGIEVAEIGVGAWQFGADDWNGPGEDTCRVIIDEAIRRGATFIDTAPAYGDGESERILGRVLEGRRDQVVLCTKVGFWPGSPPDWSADRIEESVEASLERLRTDYLDVLLIHSPPPEVFDGRRVQHYEVMQRLKDAGVIRAYGISGTVDTASEIRTAADTTGCDAIEIRFNPLHQEPASAFHQASEAGIGLIVKVPLESGWLSGNYGPASTFDGTRSRWSTEDIARRAALVRQFETLLPSEVTTPHGALSHILAHPEVSTVVPGTRSLDHLRNNLAAADVKLPPATLQAIRSMGDSLAEDPLPW
jgi:aryl-alcohol dehydrogenase-like predicted oxidoreductase